MLIARLSAEVGKSNSLNRWVRADEQYQNKKHCASAKACAKFVTISTNLELQDAVDPDAGESSSDDEENCAIDIFDEVVDEVEVGNGDE